MSNDFEQVFPAPMIDKSVFRAYAASPCLAAGNVASIQDRFDIVVIEDRAFARDCLVKSLRDSTLSGQIHSFSSVDEFARLRDRRDVSTVFIMSGEHRNLAEVERDCAHLSTILKASPKIVLLGRESDADVVLSALRWGVKAYVPVTLSFDLALDAIRTVLAGGIYIPPAAATRTERTTETASASATPVFTSRQMLVVEAMRRGKSNKIIAHELQMAEATVKVHVSNIMRKLNARNRTEVAIRFNAS